MCKVYRQRKDSMNKANKILMWNYRRLVFAVLLFLSALFILFYYYMEANKLTFLESSVSLGEVSRQMSDSIEQQCEDRWKALDMISYYLCDAEADQEAAKRFLEQARLQWGFDSLCLLDSESTYYDNERKISMLTQKDVTERLIAGRERIILDDVIYGGTRQMIFLLPVDHLIIQGHEFRAIGLRYGSGNIFDILSIDAFGGQSDLYITYKDGTTLYRSTHGTGIDGYNLFNSLEPYEFTSGSVQQLRDGWNGNGGLFMARWEGGLYYINQMPIDVGDWQLVMMVPVDAVSGSMKHFSCLSGLCLGAVATLLLTAVALFYIDFMKRSLYAEEEARKAAESASRSKSQFLSSMSHDIRTPMNAVVGMTHIAEDHLDNPEKVKECLNKIRLSGQLLVGLINDILDMSKIESGKMILNNEPASLNQLMDNIVNITQPMIREKRQNFNIRINQVRHEHLCFDALRLNQVMINLLSNALKFTPEEGDITVDVTEVELTPQGRARFVIQVSDTGIGMEEEFVGRIFDSFSREQDSRVNRIEGSGLGMAITKQIVDLMGGTISVKSAPGKGSTFTVKLDFEVDETACEEVPPLPPIRVLLADDDPATCQAAGGFLNELGLDGDTACGGLEALEMAREAHRAGRDYRIVFLDWRMPDLDGISVVRKLRFELGEEVSVFIISAYDWTEIEKEAKEAGVNGFIRKPFFRSTLYRLLSRYLSGEEAPEKPKEESVPDFSSCRILVVEDNELNREIVEEILLSMKTKVELACDGAMGLAMFKESSVGYYDAVLMDVQMPVMNGYQATVAIRGLLRPDAKTVPIIAMTADAFAEDVAASKDAGMTAHLAKPLDISAMIRTLSKYL